MYGSAFAKGVGRRSYVGGMADVARQWGKKARAWRGPEARPRRVFAFGGTIGSACFPTLAGDGWVLVMVVVQPPRGCLSPSEEKRLSTLRRCSIAVITGINVT